MNFIIIFFKLDNYIEMYWTDNEEKSGVAERLNRNWLKNKICKHMHLYQKNVYIDNLDNIVNDYNNTYH